MIFWWNFSIDALDWVGIVMVPDEPFCLDVDVKVVVEQVDVRHEDDAGELLLLDGEVNAEVWDVEVIVDVTDVVILMRQEGLNLVNVDEHFYYDDHVLIDEQVDVWWTDGPDESLCLDVDVEVDDSVDRDVVGPVDADVVQ